MKRRRAPAVEQEDDSSTDPFSSLFIAQVMKTTKGEAMATTLRDLPDEPPVKSYIKTGIFSVDKVFSNEGGIGVGRAIELFGDEATSKSSLSQLIAGKILKDRGYVLYLDFEDSLNPKHAKQYGISGQNRFIRVTPEHMEQGWDIFYQFLKMMKDKKVSQDSLIVWDSIAMAPTKGELEGAAIAEQARVMSLNSRRARRRITTSNCAVIFINQIRTKMNIGGPAYGDQTSRPAGKALDFMCDGFFRMKKFKLESVGSGQERSAKGVWINIQAQKNRLGRPMDRATFFLSYDKKDGGPSPHLTAMYALKEAGVLKTRKGEITCQTAEGKKTIPAAEWKGFYEANLGDLNQRLSQSKIANEKSEEEAENDSE